MYFKSTANFCMQLMGEVQLLNSESEYLDTYLPPLGDLSAYLKDYIEVYYILLMYWITIIFLQFIPVMLLQRLNERISNIYWFWKSITCGSTSSTISEVVCLQHPLTSTVWTGKRKNNNIKKMGPKALPTAWNYLLVSRAAGNRESIVHSIPSFCKTSRSPLRRTWDTDETMKRLERACLYVEAEGKEGWLLRDACSFFLYRFDIVVSLKRGLKRSYSF